LISNLIAKGCLMTRALPATLALAVACLVGLAGCGSDDGAGVRSEGQQTATSGSSGSGSGSGLSGSDLDTPNGDKEVEAGAAAYRRYALGEVGTLRAQTTRFTDAVRAGNVEQAKQLYAPSRASWERIEPIAGLVSEIDGLVDSRVDDFAGPDDPEFTGWHRLEYLLWVKRTTAGAKPFADQLDRDLSTLAAKLETAPITAKAVALGAGELVDEVSKGKITGEEDRYSHTDLWDFAANIDGSRAALQVFQPVLTKKDSALLRTLRGQFSAVDSALAPYRLAVGGYQPYTALRPADKTRMQAQLAALAESLAKLPAALGVA
jgi:iron uptake system component EfeO